MQLDRVTITGADDSVDPRDLLKLSAKFPFVEWGLLFKYQHDGEIKPRWPRLRWMEMLFDCLRGEPLTQRFALHLCGMAKTRFLEGSPSLLHGGVESVPAGLLAICRRIQINSGGEPQGWSPKNIDHLCTLHLPLARILIQIDGSCGENILQDLYEEEIPADPFFDRSYGKGVLTGEWPKNEYVVVESNGEESQEVPAYCGQAGGLTPDNIEEQLPRIAVAAGGRFWVDTETGVRSVRDGRDVLDLEKVDRFLELCAPHVEG